MDQEVCPEECREDQEECPAVDNREAAETTVVATIANSDQRQSHSLPVYSRTLFCYTNGDFMIYA